MTFARGSSPPQCATVLYCCGWLELRSAACAHDYSFLYRSLCTCACVLLMPCPARRVVRDDGHNMFSPQKNSPRFTPRGCGFLLAYAAASARFCALVRLFLDPCVARHVSGSPRGGRAPEAVKRTATHLHFLLW